jgi:S1-C subfamily serine protease
MFSDRKRIGVFRALVALAAAFAAMPVPGAAIEDTIARVKRSVVAVGTFERTRSPPFQFRGTGFVVGDGRQIVTNAHVLPATLDKDNRETIAILLPAPPRTGTDEPQVQLRAAKQVAIDPEHDLAVVAIEGVPLAALAVGESSRVREGNTLFFTGFPIGAVLGPHPATHRALVASITPIAIPQATSSKLEAKTIKRIAAGPLAVFQLDGTAYPGNSGSPLYDGESGEVLGVINMVLVKATKESALTQPSGISYAIPAEHLRTLLAKPR